MAETTTIRVSRDTRDTLNDLAARRGRTVSDTVERATRLLQQELIGRDLAAPLRDDETAWVLGSDQTLAFNGGLISKAPTLAAARDRLKAMRGRTHQLHSGAALATKGQVVWSGPMAVMAEDADLQARCLGPRGGGR